MNETSQAMPHICTARCNACGRCITVCPCDVFGQENDTIIVAHPERCEVCGACEVICPTDAIEIAFTIVWADSATKESEPE